MVSWLMSMFINLKHVSGCNEILQNTHPNVQLIRHIVAYKDLLIIECIVKDSFSPVGIVEVYNEGSEHERAYRGNEVRGREVKIEEC